MLILIKFPYIFHLDKIYYPQIYFMISLNDDLLRITNLSVLSYLER